jgi:hypothetical protein
MGGTIGGNRMPRGSQGWFAIGGLALFAFWLYVFLPLLLPARGEWGARS